jgi:uncharacterized protein with HEPN domain
MPSDQTRKRLSDIRKNILLAQSFIAGKTYAEFQNDQKLYYAVTRCLEIVSEASRHLDDEVRRRHPDLPRRDIVSAGNVYRHGYGNVTEELVWFTATQVSMPCSRRSRRNWRRVNQTTPSSSRQFARPS